MTKYPPYGQNSIESVVYKEVAETADFDEYMYETIFVNNEEIFTEIVEKLASENGISLSQYDIETEAIHIINEIFTKKDGNIRAFIPKVADIWMGKTGWENGWREDLSEYEYEDMRDLMYEIVSDCDMDIYDAIFKYAVREAKKMIR